MLNGTVIFCGGLYWVLRWDGADAAWRSGNAAPRSAPQSICRGGL